MQGENEERDLEWAMTALYPHKRGGVVKTFNIGD